MVRVEIEGGVLFIEFAGDRIAEENAASTEETSASVTEISGIINEIADEAYELKNISNQMDETMSMFEL